MTDSIIDNDIELLRRDRDSWKYLADSANKRADELAARFSTSAQRARTPDAWLHEITEPEHGTLKMYSARPDNPWSHWTETHRKTCVYKRTPLYAEPNPASQLPEGAQRSKVCSFPDCSCDRDHVVALATCPAGRPDASPIPEGDRCSQCVLEQAHRDAGWIGLSASEKAAYDWPDDTDIHRQCRAAYVAGATDYARPSEGHGGWQSIDTAPKDKELLLGWWSTWPELFWETAAGLAGSTKGGWLHGQATHWMPLPTPPSHPSTERRT